MQSKAQLKSKFKDRSSTGGAPNSSAVLTREGRYLTRGKVWAVFTSLASPASKAEGELPEEETLSSSCGWKLGHVTTLHPNAPVKPWQGWELGPAYPRTRRCSPFEYVQWLPRGQQTLWADVYPKHDNSYSTY